MLLDLQDEGGGIGRLYRIKRGGPGNPTMNTCGVVTDVSHSRPVGVNDTSIAVLHESAMG